MKPSPLYRLIEARLDGTLDEYVVANRATKSWRTMASELCDLTGVAVNYETLRLWFAGRVQTSITVAARGAA